MFSVCIDVLKARTFYPRNIMQSNAIGKTSVSEVQITTFAGFVTEFKWNVILESASSCVKYKLLFAHFTHSFIFYCEGITIIIIFQKQLLFAKCCIKELLKWSLQNTVTRPLLGQSTIAAGIWSIKWSSISFTIFNWRLYYLSKTKLTSRLVAEQMRPSIYRAIEANEDGGPTNKCKKNIASIIIASMLAEAEQMQHVTLVPAIALLWVCCILPSTFARKRGIWVGGYFKTSPMSILCLREKNNMEPNKSLIKLIAIISLSFPWNLGVVIVRCVCMNFVRLYTFFKYCRVFNTFFNKFLTCLPSNTFNI